MIRKISLLKARGTGGLPGKMRCVEGNVLDLPSGMTTDYP
jgi:hypothetical protein